MPIITTQRRARELGRIRLGDKGAKGQPQKLNRFRLTTQARELLDTAATLYGGEVRKWEPRGGAPQWELYTDARRIPVIVPPQPVSQWMEFWLGGTCKHRCDGEINALTGDTCDLEETVTVRVRGNDVDVNPHTEAKPTTRLKVILRDVEGVGVWRLESHGWNAAVELPDAAEFLAQAGGYIDGHLALEERIIKTDQGTNRFVVPIIEIGVTPAELFAGKGRIVPALAGGPVPPAEPDTKALTAAQGPEDRTLPGYDDIAAAADLDTLTGMRAELIDAGALSPELHEASLARRQELLNPPAPPTTPPANGDPWAEQQQPDEDGAVDAVIVEDPAAADAAWARVLKAAGGLTPPMSTADVNADFEQQYGYATSNADAAALTAYAEQLEGAQA